MESILDGAIIEYEEDNPEIMNNIEELVEGDLVDKILFCNICNFLGINDNNYTDPEIFDKINKIISITGKDNALNVIQKITGEVGFKPGVLDEIYSKLRLENIYGNSSNI